MKKLAKVVYVDSTEVASLPTEVSTAINAAGNTIPRLVFMSPDHQTVLGSFDHPKMKAQDYNKIFKEVKAKIKEAKKDGQLSESGVVAKDDDDKDKEKSDAVVIKSPKLAVWKSIKGVEINAKLTKFEADTYHLVTSKGKSIKVMAKDLDPATLKMAEELVEENKK